LTRVAPAPTPGPLARVVVFWAMLAGCGETEIAVIDMLPVPDAAVPDAAVPDAAVPDAAAPDAGAPGPPPKPPGPTGPEPPADRGRVQVRDGNLLTDKGTRLRGVTFGIDVQPDVLPLEASLFEQMSRETGLNALHVYVENQDLETGANVAKADILVELTSAAGIYLLLGIGGGNAGGTFDIDKVRSFWSFYAPRYAGRTHVLFEIQNIPDPGCDVPYQAATLDMQREIYELIRSEAPDTHVALYSFSAPPSGPALEANLDALGGTVAWSQASVIFHIGSCAGQDYLPDLLAVTRSRGVAAFVGELQYFTSYDTVAQLEGERVGWFDFEWLVQNRDLAAFRAGHEAAGITWCPDFGAWPEDSQTCSTP
jgi:hypothetical protein